MNELKTQPIIIGSKNMIDKVDLRDGELPRIRMGETEVEYMDSVKYLGFHFNKYFTPENQVKSIVQKVNMALSRVKHRRKSLSTNIKLELTRAIILPLFDYASIIHHGFNIHGSIDNEKRLNVLMNSCVRFICNLTGRDHVSGKYVELNLLNAFNRRVLLICSFIYNYIIYY